MMNTPSDFQTPAAPGMVNADQRPVDVVVLFSGGLDSILAAKVLEEQGLRVCCLHCHSPFFGDPGAVERWSNLYGLDIRTLDVSDDFCAMLRARPAHGFGKVMNPCVDCKILLLRHARLYMESIGARLLATGEVMGQRPMSQRRDVLNAIRRDAGLQDILLRPLSALHLAPTPAEEEGFVDRSRLLGISGRGRKDQLELAKKYQLPEIPTPGGGCRLADKENARRYWPVLSRWPEPDTRAFKLSNLGRQFWAQQDGRDYWLAIGRTSADNQALHTVLGKDDAKIHLADIPGPLAVACGGRTWPEEVLRAAAALMASYSGKAVRLGAPVGVRASWLGGGWQDSSKLYLRCEGCGNTAVMDMDATVNGIVRQFRNHEQPSCTAYTPSAEVMRLDNAINRGLEQPDSPEAVMALILQGAAARYACCPEPSAESEPSDSLTEADWRRFQRAVSHITISQDTEVTLIFTDKKATGKDE